MGAIGKLLLLVATAGGAAGEPCDGQRGFDRGRAGLEAAAHCGSDDYASAWRLGGELAALLRERDALAAGQSGRSAPEQNAAARRMRQLEVDVEAIRGVLQLRGIVVEGPVPGGGAPAGADTPAASSGGDPR